MPRVYVSIQEYPMGFYVIFYEGKHSIGPIRRYRSEETIFLLLRRAHANLETLNIVEHALRNRTPCTVDVNLTDEQYKKLSSSRP